MAAAIEQAEVALTTLQSEMSKPHVASSYGRLQQLMQEQETAQKKLEQLFQRWEELEQKATEAPV